MPAETTIQDVMYWWWRMAVDAGWDVEYRNHPYFKGLPVDWAPVDDKHQFGKEYQYRLKKEKISGSD